MYHPWIRWLERLGGRAVAAHYCCDVARRLVRFCENPEIAEAFIEAVLAYQLDPTIEKARLTTDAYIRTQSDLRCIGDTIMPVSDALADLYSLNAIYLCSNAQRAVQAAFESENQGCDEEEFRRWSEVPLIEAAWQKQRLTQYLKGELPGK